MAGSARIFSMVTNAIVLELALRAIFVIKVGSHLVLKQLQIKTVLSNDIKVGGGGECVKQAKY